MSQSLYIIDPKNYLKLNGQTLELCQRLETGVSKTLQHIPLGTLEAVVALNGASITSAAISALLEYEIPLTIINRTGKVFGRLENTTGINIERQVKQFRVAEDEAFCLSLAKLFIGGKIRNTRVLLSRWARERNRRDELNDLIEQLKRFEQDCTDAPSIPSLMGTEGNAARVYYQGFSTILPARFSFPGRRRRPPTDPVNAMLSLGYTLLMYECYTALQNKGLHPYMAFLHKIRRGHPALASDLMEEWRPLLVDSLVMHLITHQLVTPEDFSAPDPETQAVYCQGEASKVFISGFHKKLKTENRYITEVDYPLSYRESLQYQVASLVRAIEHETPNLYTPCVIR